MTTTERHIKAFQWGTVSPQANSTWGKQNQSGFDGMYMTKNPSNPFYKKPTTTAFYNGNAMTEPSGSTKGTEVNNPNNTTVSNENTNMSGRNSMAIGTMASNAGASYLSKENEGNDKYALSNYSDNTVQSGMEAFGPWGQLISSAINIGSEGAKAYGGKTNEYGIADNEKKYEAGQTAGAMLKPWETNKKIDTQKEFLTDEEKSQFGNTQLGQIAGIVAPGIGGHQAAKNQKAIGEDMASADESFKEKELLLKDSKARINTSKERYNRSVANSQYGIRVAKIGGILNNKNLLIKSVPKAVTYIPYTRTSIFKTELKEEIKGLQKGGSVIPNGAYHHTSNNLGDKGLPVVDDNGVKIFEVELKELMLDNEVSNNLSSLVNEYNTTGDEDLLFKISSITIDELTNNTYSYNPEYSCLNDNSCSLKN